MNSKTIAWLWRMRRMPSWHASHMKLWSTKKNQLALLQIRRITFHTYGITLSRLHQKMIQDTREHAPHKRLKIHRIVRRCTNIREYINLGPHAKLPWYAASDQSDAPYRPYTILTKNSRDQVKIRSLKKKSKITCQHSKMLSYFGRKIFIRTPF